MKKLILIILALVLFLSSCELTTEEVKPNIKLVTVALSYKDSVFRALPNTLNDQSALVTQLKLLSEKAGYNFEEHTFTEDNGHFYYNGGACGPTFADDLDTLFTDTLLKNSKSNDITIFYYSGHGGLDGTLLIGLHNPLPTPNDKDNFHNILNYKNNNLTLQKLQKYITPLNGKKLIILDSCYSGNVIQNTDNALKLNEILQKGFKNLFSQEKIENQNTWYLSAASSDEESVEIDYLKHGLFTYYLLQALGFDTDKNIATNSSPLGSDNAISVNELFDYIDTKVKKENIQHTQKGMSMLDLVLFNWD